MVDLISSRSNPKIKQVRSLRQSKARKETGLFVIEGIRPVGEAFEAGAAISAIFYAPDDLKSEYANRLLDQATSQGIQTFATTPEVFDAIAEKDNPQGILAVIHQPKKRLNDLNPQTFTWGVALVDPQDPGNVGTILRTIDAVGANGMLLLSGGTRHSSVVDLYHPNSVRASMGTLFWHPVIISTFGDFTTWAEQHGYHLYGTSAHGTEEYQRVDRYIKPCILIMGSEREGLTSEQASICEKVIRLPMHGRATSLNLGVATGVMLYDMLVKIQ